MFNKIILVSVLCGLVIGSMAFVYSKSRPAKDGITLVQPFRTTIRETITANGSIVPREEVMVKPQISGVVKQLFVNTGDTVMAGDLLAVVEPQPSPTDVSQAAKQLREAEIRAAHAARELKRGEQIITTGAITESDFRKLQLELEIANANLDAAKRLVEIVRTGASVELGRSASEVRATIAGTVLERPVDIGSFVIETNTFNEGTTVVKLADMGDLVFKGEVDEEDAGQLFNGMPLSISIGAFPEKSIDAVLEMIAPQSSQRNERRAGTGATLSKQVDGITSFEIRAKLQTGESTLLRAGYSATADAEIKRVDDVIAIEERNLRFRDGLPYVSVQLEDNRIVDRNVVIGLSDGLNIEIREGLNETADIVVVN